MMNTTPAPMVHITALRKAYGKRVVLKDISLAVPKGEVCFLMGPSGSGKSTLLRCVNFLETYDAGGVWLDGELVGYRDAATRQLRSRAEIARMRSRCVIVFQQFNLFQHMTALENVSVAPIKVLGADKREANARAEALLVKVGLKDRMRAYPAFLSGGEQQRVAIARALAMDPKVLLLDEVTSALDPERVSEVLSVIEELAAEGMTMLVVTHQVSLARHIAHQVVFMDGGLVLETGGPDMLDAPRTERLRGFIGSLARVDSGSSAAATVGC